MNGLSLTQVLIMVVVALLLATGQLLFKHGAVLAAPATDFSGAIKLFSHPVILGAICLYALVTFIWVYMLQHVSLSRAYPFFCVGICTGSHRRVVCVPRADDGAISDGVVAGYRRALCFLYRTLNENLIPGWSYRFTDLIKRQR